TPLGFGNIKAAVATLMGLMAKEEIVGVFGVLDFEGLTPLSGYSFLLFNLLCAPCFAAMGAIRREMNSARWTAFAILYQCTLAYAVSLMVYQFGLLWQGQPHPVGLTAAAITLLVLLFMVLRPASKKK
ncbi:MAG: ferrous iron transporter B, partial [Clostridia bacterium]|nr:ferrous iron transporter B [Clostridia bacterium]